MTKNERELRKVISDLDIRVLYLENIMRDIDIAISSIQPTPSCNKCGSTPSQGFICGDIDCPHGLNSEESCDEI